jgi:hypothetical protein
VARCYRHHKRWARASYLVFVILVVPDTCQIRDLPIGNATRAASSTSRRTTDQLAWTICCHNYHLHRAFNTFCHGGGRDRCNARPLVMAAEQDNGTPRTKTNLPQRRGRPAAMGRQAGRSTVLGKTRCAGQSRSRFGSDEHGHAKRARCVPGRFDHRADPVRELHPQRQRRARSRHRPATRRGSRDQGGRLKPPGMDASTRALHAASAPLPNRRPRRSRCHQFVLLSGQVHYQRRTSSATC